MLEKQRLIDHAQRIIAETKTQESAFGLVSEAAEFLRQYAGEKSFFYKSMNKVTESWDVNWQKQVIVSNLQAFIRYVENDLLDGVSIQRQAQLDVVSDFLGQAQSLLDSHDVHPAAPTVLIGASLEEFLRNWVDASEISMGGKKPSIDAYAKSLREAELISGQDMKDITSWAGIRNSASHGKWDEVNSKDRVRIMLEGVNLFMRQHTKS